VGDLLDSEAHSREMSKIGIAWIIGGLTGPALGAILATRGVFLMGIFCAFTSLAALGISLLSLQNKKTSAVCDTGKSISTRTARPLLSFVLLANQKARQLLSQNFLAMLAHFIFNTTMTLYVSARLGLSIMQIGRVFTAIGIANLLLRLLVFPVVLKKLGERVTFNFGILLYILAFAWLMAATRLGEFMAITILISFGTSCSSDVMNGIMSKAVPRQQIGEMMGLNSAAESLSLILSPIIGGTMLSASIPALYGLAALLASGLALLISHSYRKEPIVTAQVK
jgi:MFS family permease